MSPEVPFGSRNHLAIHLALVGASLFALLNTGAFTGIIPYCVAELGQHQSHGAWMNGEFFAAQALGMLLANRLGERVGRLRLFYWAGWATGLGALLCSLAPGFVFFLLARIVLGGSGGVLIVLAPALLLETTRPRFREFAPVLWAAVAILPFTIGPLLGGWLEERWGREGPSWRLWFLVDGAVELVCAEWARRLLKATATPGRPDVCLDWTGFGLLATFLFSLQTALDMGDDYDWYNSSLFDLLSAVAAASFLAFSWWELRIGKPLVRLTLFLRPTFAAGMVCLCGGFLLFYGLWSLVLVRLQSAWGYSPWLAGLVWFSLTAGALPMALLSARIGAWHRTRFLLIGSLLLFAGFSLWTSYYEIYRRRNLWLEFIGPQLIEGIGLGLFLPPVTNFLSSGLSTRNRELAVEMAGSFRVAAQGWATLLLGTVLYHQTAFHKRRLVEWLSPGHPLLGGLRERFSSEGIGWKLGFRLLDRAALEQTQVLAFEDLFRIASWGFCLLAALILLCPAPPRARQGARESGGA
ncbi:MAG: MFS transporter [Candidatus Methylacidiphilaceae bacterium]